MRAEASGARFINLEIQAQLPQYTVEQIKGVRNKNKEYKPILNCVRASMSGTTAQLTENAGDEAEVDPPPVDPTLPDTDPPVSAGESSSFACKLLDAIDFDLLCGDMNLSSDPRRLVCQQWFLDRCYSTHFPAKEVRQKAEQNRNKNKKGKTKVPTRKQARRQLYARVQKQFVKDKKQCVNSIIDGTYAEEHTCLPDGTAAFWREMFNTPSQPDSRKPVRLKPLDSLLRPIGVEEVQMVLRSKQKSSPGPDGYTWNELKKVKIELLISLLNLTLLSGRVPAGMSDGITTLLPKVKGTKNPAEMRPITVTSVLGRLYHCVLGNRFEAELPISDAQKGFWKGDGLYLNSQLLQKAITVARRDYKNLRIGFVDVKKAFDSVSHDSLWVACMHMRMYISDATTKLAIQN